MKRSRQKLKNIFLLGKNGTMKLEAVGTMNLINFVMIKIIFQNLTS